MARFVGVLRHAVKRPVGCPFKWRYFARDRMNGHCVRSSFKPLIRKSRAIFAAQRAVWRWARPVAVGCRMIRCMVDLSARIQRMANPLFLSLHQA